MSRDLFHPARPLQPEARPDDPVAQLVVVCHANIARSPLAMVLLEAEAHRRLGRSADVWVRSAGVHALEGQPAAAESAHQARLRGLDLTHHRGALLGRGDVEDADLVLTMTERQRTAAVRLCQNGQPRTFTVPEFARLARALAADDVPIEDCPARTRVRDVVRHAHRLRATVPGPSDPEDVADPFGGPRAGYQRMAAELERHLSDIAPVLFGPTRS